MAFIKRLGWYLVGLSIGIIFLAFFLKKKSDETGTSFCYLPNCRVLKDLRSKSFSMLNQLSDTIAYADLDAEIRAILENGNVDFKNSKTKMSSCKVYFIDDATDKVRLKIKNCDKMAIIEQISIKKD